MQFHMKNPRCPGLCVDGHSELKDDVELGALHALAVDFVKLLILFLRKPVDPVSNFT